MVEFENCAGRDYSDPRVEAYVRGISEALLAERAGLGWGWVQSMPPQKQTLLCLSVGGEPIAALIDRSSFGRLGEQRTYVNIAFDASDGCCAHHVEFDPDANRYRAVAIDYGWAAKTIVDVVWAYDPTSGTVSLEGYFEGGSFDEATPVTGAMVARDRMRQDDRSKAKAVSL